MNEAERAIGLRPASWSNSKRSTPRSYADAYFGLLEELEGLFAWPVDLVMTSAITNPYFLQEIARNRTVVFGS